MNFYLPYLHYPLNYGPVCTENKLTTFVPTANSDVAPSELEEKYFSLKQNYEKLRKDFKKLKNYMRTIERKNRRKKIHRRKENELEKAYECPFPECCKEYASSLALNLHMKTKHNAGTKRQRKRIIKEIIEGKLPKDFLTTLDINIPSAEFQREKEKILNQNQTEALLQNFSWPPQVKPIESQAPCRKEEAPQQLSVNI